jgi:membrane protease YdiL (CAAX protease family)
MTDTAASERKSARTKQLAGFGLAVAAGVAIGIVLTDLPGPARWMCGFLAGTFPVLMLWRGAPTADLINSTGKTAVYYGSAASLWIIAFGALAAAATSGFSRVLLGLRMLPVPQLLVWSVAITIAALIIVVLGHRFGIEESSTLRALLPHTTREKMAFAFLCLSAGVCEEFAFRSFLIPALSTRVGSIWTAAILSAIVFGILHAYQRVWGALRAGVLGFTLALPFVLTGSVLPSMIAHTAIDLIAGLVLRDRLLGSAEREMHKPNG